MPKTITISDDVYAAILARRLDKNESEDAILTRILVRAGDSEAIHAQQQQPTDQGHLILDSDMDHDRE